MNIYYIFCCCEPPFVCSDKPFVRYISIRSNYHFVFYTIFLKKTGTPMAIGNIIDNIGQIFSKKPTRVGTIDVGDEKTKIESIGTNLYKINAAGFVEIINSGAPTIVDCYTEWCGPCKMIDPIFAKLADEYNGKVKFIKIELDANPTIARHFKIMGVPTLMLIKDRVKIKSIVGYSGEGKIRRAVDKMLEMEIDQFDL